MGVNKDEKSIVVYQDPMAYHFPVRPIAKNEKDEENLCRYKVNSGLLHHSVKIGGCVTMGMCGNETLPGMIFCYIHADREAMAMQLRRFDNELKQKRSDDERSSKGNKKSNKR